MSTLFSLVMLLSAQDPTTGWAPAAVESAPADPWDERLAPFFAGIEDAPTPARWRELPDGAAAALAARVDDTVLVPRIRMLALDGLVVLSPPDALPRARAWARDADPVLQAAAAHALSRLVRAEALPAELRPLLDGAVPSVRLQAVTVLARSGNRAACRLARAQAARETADRQPFDHAASRCGPAPSTRGR